MSFFTKLLSFAAQTLSAGEKTQARTNIDAAKSGDITASGLTISTQKLAGRGEPGTGATKEVTIGANLALSAGNVLSAVGGGGTTGLTFLSGGPVSVVSSINGTSGPSASVDISSYVPVGTKAILVEARIGDSSVNYATITIHHGSDNYLVAECAETGLSNSFCHVIVPITGQAFTWSSVSVASSSGYIKLVGYLENITSALVADAINDGETAVAPSQNAVFDALALKAALTQRLGATVNAQVGTTYTIVSGDAYKTLTLNNASPITVTCSGLADGDQIIIEQLGAGQVTFSSGTLTLRNVAGLTKIAGQYGRVYARVSGTDFIVDGAMS